MTLNGLQIGFLV